MTIVIETRTRKRKQEYSTPILILKRLVEKLLTEMLLSMVLQSVLYHQYVLRYIATLI